MRLTCYLWLNGSNPGLVLWIASSRHPTRSLTPAYGADGRFVGLAERPVLRDEEIRLGWFESDEVVLRDGFWADTISVNQVNHHQAECGLVPGERREHHGAAADGRHARDLGKYQPAPQRRERHLQCADECGLGGPDAKHPSASSTVAAAWTTPNPAGRTGSRGVTAS